MLHLKYNQEKYGFYSDLTYFFIPYRFQDILKIQKQSDLKDGSNLELSFRRFKNIAENI